MGLHRIYRGLRRRVRKASGKPPKDNPFDAIYKHFFDRDDALVVFDVGAHMGESVVRFRTMFPRSVIHSFEADRENYANLSRNFSGQADLHLNNFGVSSGAGTLKFHRNIKTNTSSFLEIDPTSEWARIRSLQFGVAQEDFTEKVYDVRTETLDAYIDEHDVDAVDVLKIDTQGHEEHVLRGCAGNLERRRIRMIETELIVGDAYEKSLDFYSLEKILIPRGYRLYGIDHGGDLLSCPYLNFNVLYINEDFLASRG